MVPLQPLRQTGLGVLVMAWLRIDDGFAFHPKLVQMSRADRWTWLEILCYCARYRTDGQLPSSIAEAIPKANRAFLEKCGSVGLLDVTDESGYEVHDWRDFNPKDVGAADRQQRNRERAPQPQGAQWERTRKAIYERDAGICADCGKDCSQPKDGRDIWNADHEPPRDDLAAQGISIYDLAFIVTRCHSCHSKKTRRQAIERKQAQLQPNDDRTATEPCSGVFGLSRAGARAQPVPSSPVVTTTADDLAASARLRLISVGWNKNQFEAAADDLERAVAWVNHAASDPDCQSVGALSWSMFKQGGWPEEPKEPQSTLAAGAVGTRSLTPKPKFECPECGVGFRSESAYEDHLANVHDAAVPA